MKFHKKPVQMTLFEPDVIREIENILDRFLQPSAAELVSMLTKILGKSVLEDIKGAVLHLLDINKITSANRTYLKYLIEDKSLDMAIAGENDCKDRKEIETGIDHLLSSSIKYKNSREFRELITFVAKFRDYSPYNNMLVRIQNPGCNFFATASDWRKRFSRDIKEDARPMVILAPMHPVMLVYDTDQTYGDNLPAGFDKFSKFDGPFDEKWIDRLTTNLYRHKIRLEYKTLSSSLAGFATHSSKNNDWKMRIVIHDELDGPSRFGVLCHEVAHIFLGHLGGDKDLWWPSRMNLNHKSKEIEAESVAYIITQHFGLNGSSDMYVSSHLKNDTAIPEGVSLDNIGKVSSKIREMSLRTLPEPKLRTDLKKKKTS